MDTYILDGTTPVPEPDLAEWGRWMSLGISNRIVSKSYIHTPGAKKVEVSTVFLGIDHGWCGRVELFETMVFGGPRDEYQRRYATWAEAEAGHKEIMDSLRPALTGADNDN